MIRWVILTNVIIVPGFSGTRKGVGLSLSSLHAMEMAGFPSLAVCQLRLLTSITPTCHYYKLVRNAYVRRKQIEEVNELT